jgi:hypothetical protein
VKNSLAKGVRPGDLVGYDRGEASQPSFELVGRVEALDATITDLCLDGTAGGCLGERREDVCR